jgi:hypothetical protein
MIGPFQVTGGVLVAGKLRPEVHGGPATLPVVRPHGQVKRAREHIRANGEIPTPADARHFQVILAGLLQLGKIRFLDDIAGIRIVGGLRQLAAEGHGVVAGAAHGEFLRQVCETTIASLGEWGR